MKKSHKKVNLTSSDLSEEKLQELYRILPEAFSENKINWDKLRAVLGDKIDSRIEKFSFSWAGKGDAIKSVLIPSKATLSPAKNESIRFDKSENIFIEGDNLEVLKLLQKAYFEQVKMIYIDPPYNTGGDFVYRDDFSAPLKNYLEQTGQIDNDGNKLQANRETSGRYHSDWLSMMYPRLKLAWNLLRDDGVIFISIGDVEVANLIKLMDEIFGEECRLGIISRTTKTTSDVGNYFAPSVDYILAYQKKFDGVEEFRAGISPEDEKQYRYKDKRGRKYKLVGFYQSSLTLERSRNARYYVTCPDGTKCIPVEGKRWRWIEPSLLEAEKEGLVEFKETKSSPLIDNKGLKSKWNVYIRQYLHRRKEEGRVPRNYLHDFPNTLGTNLLKKMGLDFPDLFPKPLELIEYLIEISNTSGNDIVLDFFAGSATTAHAVLNQNNKLKENKLQFICIQLPELTKETSDAYRGGFKTIAEIAKKRICRAIKGFSNKPEPFDDGFKVFKLTESNYPENSFEFDPEQSKQENREAFEKYLANAKQANLFEDGIKEIDVVYENVVKEGLSLNAKIFEEKIGKNKVYVASDGERRVLVCLDKKIDSKTIDELTSKDYKGKTFICLDNALDDTAKANLGLNVELKTI